MYKYPKANYCVNCGTTKDGHDEDCRKPQFFNGVLVWLLFIETETVNSQYGPYEKVVSRNETFKILPTKKEVCPCCDGEGTELRGGLKGAVFYPEDFENDPEFAENYFGGAYDVACSHCNGKNVSDEIDLSGLSEKEIKAYWEYVDDCSAQDAADAAEMRFCGW